MTYRAIGNDKGNYFPLEIALTLNGEVLRSSLYGFLSAPSSYLCLS